MAKQQGIHQLRGKVAGMSYYRQTGVADGLVRTINTAMSSRVKTDEAYANTRLNNAEFGQAARIAGELGRYITPKFRPMILPFSQSKMAKMLLEAIKAKTGNWGERNLEAGDMSVTAQTLSSVAKNNFADYGVIFDYDTQDIRINTDDTNFPAKLAAIGADKMLVRVIAANTWVGTYSAGTGKYNDSHARGNYEDTSFNAGGGDFGVTVDFPSDPQTGWPAVGIHNWILIVLPVRTINGQDHILQEYCTFKAFDGEGRE